MKFTFTQNWNSNKVGDSENIPKQLAEMLQKQGYGKIDDNVKKYVNPKKSEAKEFPNEAPKSNAKPS